MAARKKTKEPESERTVGGEVGSLGPPAEGEYDVTVRVRLSKRGNTNRGLEVRRLAERAFWARMIQGGGVRYSDPLVDVVAVSVPPDQLQDLEAESPGGES